MCEVWQMLTLKIIAKDVCDIKTDHQTEKKHFLFATIVLIKVTKLDHPMLAFWWNYTIYPIFVMLFLQCIFVILKSIIS